MQVAITTTITTITTTITMGIIITSTAIIAV
jgi:hypothetical protein